MDPVGESGGSLLQPPVLRWVPSQLANDIITSWHESSFPSSLVRPMDSVWL